MKTDMTKGNPMKIILMFSIPVLMGNLFQQFYNMVDTIIVGQYLGSDALAAVGSTGCLMFLVLGFANGIAPGLRSHGKPCIWGEKRKTAQALCCACYHIDGDSFGSAYDTDSARIKAVSYMDEHTGEYSEYGGCIYKGYFCGNFLHYVI